MKILLTGTIHSFADKKGTAVVEAKRRAKEGVVAETFYLKFHNDDAYREFKGRYALGAGLQVIGLLRQVQTPLLDRVTKQPLIGTNGRELRQALLSVEVKEHKPIQRVEEYDTLYAHGMVGVVEKKDLRQSAAGLSYLTCRVAYNHFKRPDEAEGQGDFYNLIAFGAQAESLNNLDRGDKFLIDYGVPALDAYEMRDITHSDGTPVTRNGLEIMLREFTYLPRPRQSGPAPLAPAGEEIPF
jgi:hypothetical protein